MSLGSESRLFSRRWFSRVIYVLVAVLVPIVLLSWCFRSVQLAELYAQAGRISPLWILLSFALIVGIVPAGSWQWNTILEDSRTVSFRDLFFVYAIMTAIQNSLNHFAGQGYAVFQLGQRLGSGKTGVVSLLTVDQIAEGIARILFISSLLFFIDLPDWISTGLAGLVCGVLVLLVISVVFARRFVQPPDEFKTSRNPASRLRFHIAKWGYHLHGLRHSSKFVGAVGIALSKKFLKVLAVYAVQISFSVVVPWWTPFLVVVAVDLASMASVTPGHLGLFEAAVFSAYRYVGADATTSLNVALFYHATFLAGSILPALFILAFVFRQKTQPVLPERERI